jgi:hypothetical protein
LKINSKKIIIIYSILEHHLKKIKNGDLKSAKHSKFLHHTRFSYKEFNEHDKLKFGNDFDILFELSSQKASMSLSSQYMYWFGSTI